MSATIARAYTTCQTEQAATSTYYFAMPRKRGGLYFTKIIATGVEVPPTIERAIKELSMAKAYSVEVCLRAIDRAIQTHGGMGLTNEVGLVHAYNTLRIINIADGTNEILRRTIFQQLARGDLDL